MQRALPIDAVLPELRRELAASGAVILEAEPGAGKTTRVPPALLDVVEGQIWVSEPRRLAARLAATHVARQLGERPGERVGYAVRFDEATSARTRLLYLTEGLLLRRLEADPSLSGVGLVMLDEFHERSLDADLCLALLRRARSKTRPDLRLLVTSATLDAEGLSRALGGVRRLRAEGRRFDLVVEHAERSDDRPLEKQVVGAVRRALDAEPEGDVLVFLPGAAEIRRAEAALEALTRDRDLLVLPLHGELPAAAQARAIAPASRRKVVLATNVAESSVTIDGVTAVVDSGLERRVSVSPWSGIPELETAPVSRASAIQRAGRAGRTRPGRVIRLYTAGDLAGRAERAAPEIQRADLSGASLRLRGLGVAGLEALELVDAPPAAAVRAAEQLLLALGAIDASGGLTEVGRRSLRFPVSPRLARLCVAGEDAGIAEVACLAAALLSERDLRLETRAFGRARDVTSSGSDVLELVDRFDEARRLRFDGRRLAAAGIDAAAARAADAAARQLQAIARDRASPPGSAEELEARLGRALLLAFPDRVARRRKPGERELSLATGHAARLAESSVVTHAELLLAVSVDERDPRTRRAGMIVRVACAVDLSALFDADLCELSDELEWSDERGRVELVSRIRTGSLSLEETRSAAPPSEAASACLAAAALARAGSRLDARERLDELAARLGFLARELPELGLVAPGEDAVGDAVRAAARGLTRFDELERADLPEALLGALPHDARLALDREAPSRFVLPGGRSVPIHYERDRSPWIESRLQDFFGMKAGPRIARDRVPLTVHLLAPNQRAVQVTSDLEGFWQRHYPPLRKELMRRYPRHAWPEDGAAASPPEPRRR